MFYSIIYDHLGNTRVVYEPVNDNGLWLKINYVADYFPYGKVLREYVNTLTGDPERFLTTQHERDKETGLDYRGARFYDGDVGRFLSTDPLQAKYSEWSSYNYVMGNPIMLVDPDGMDTVHIYNQWRDRSGTFNKIFSHKIFDKNIAEPVNRYDTYNTKGQVEYTQYYSRTSDKFYGFKGNKVNDWVGFYATFRGVEASRDVRANDKLYDSWAGYDDLGNMGGNYSGIQGMRNAASDLNILGDFFSYIPTFPTQILGRIYQGMGSGLNTIADYHSLDSETATQNTAIRIVTFGVGKKLNNDLKMGNFNNTQKYIGEQFIRKSLNEVESQIIIEK